MTISAVILAAGSGGRMRAGENKMFLALGGQPILVHTASAFSDHPDIDELVLVVRPSETERMRQLIEPLAINLRWIPGGETRRDSALAGVRAASNEVVLIHDGARPFPSAALISRVVAATRQSGAAVPILPMSDLVHQLSADATLQLTSSLGQQTLAIAQTPQGFHRELILRCLEAAPSDIRDDATALLLVNERVTTVLGDPCNIKITHPLDLPLAEMIAALQH